MSMPPRPPGIDTTALDQELKKLFEKLDKRFSSVDQVVNGIELKIKGSPISKSDFRNMTHEYSQRYGLLEYKSSTAFTMQKKIATVIVGFFLGFIAVFLVTMLLRSTSDTKVTPKEESLLIMTVPADDNSSSNTPMFKEVE